MEMIDLQKAFNTVDHLIPKNNPKAIGLDENAIAWFDAYLTNRMQVTDVGGIFSAPQGCSLWNTTGINPGASSFFDIR